MTLKHQHQYERLLALRHLKACMPFSLCHVQLYIALQRCAGYPSKCAIHLLFCSQYNFCTASCFSCGCLTLQGNI